MIRILKRCTLPVLTLALSFNCLSQTQAEQELNTLITHVKTDQQLEQKTHQQREHAFQQALTLQTTNLKKVQQQEQQADRIFQGLSKRLEKSQQETSALKQQLDKRAHHLSDLYSVARRIGRDTQNNLNNSLISAQLPALAINLKPLLDLEKLPEIKDISALWHVLLTDIQASSNIEVFETKVIQSNGDQLTSLVYRVGPFTASTGEHYLEYSPSDHALHTLKQQPEDTAQLLSENIASSKPLAGEIFDILIDPTKGVILARLDLEPSLIERIGQGGAVGFVIITLGLIGLLFTLFRLVQLQQINTKIKQQLKTPNQPDKNNPLGRILAVYYDSQNQQSDSELNTPKSDHYESLEIRLNEAILREAPKLDKGTGSIKLMATVAPLLGLLGTVTGMIGTFQAITLFGTGDPKLMAGGISQALITTVLGLVVAIPLLFGHSLVASRVRSLLVILSQQSLALVAKTIEQPNDSPEETLDKKSKDSAPHRLSKAGMTEFLVE